MSGGKLRRFFIATLVYLGITVATLLVIDGVCIALNLFPPTHKYGDPILGWRPAGTSRQMQVARCTEPMTGAAVTYVRNEDGVRTTLPRSAMARDSGGVRIAVSGDSHTDLCAPNSETHPGALESGLGEQGVTASVLAYGAGKYSPLQAYLAFRTVLKPYRPRVLVLNLYTGNDFYDILRVDDRPHFVRDGAGYRIDPPVWLQYDDPAVRHRSRVLFAGRALADKLGIRQLVLRVSELRRLAGEFGGGLPDVFGYMRDLWKGREASVGYADAFAAQMLNQQLFFHRFQPGMEESVRRIRALMSLARDENPGLILVMSPVPSYQLTGEQPVDSALTRILGRLPITYEEGVAQEGALYERLRQLAAGEGWGFVDNLALLRGYRGSERLFNNFDYHITPTASAIIGRAESALLLDTLRRSAAGHPPRPLGVRPTPN